MPTERGGFNFNEVLPRLVGAYETGRLVPFIGSGLSRPHCTSWPELIRRLEVEAGAPQPDSESKPDELIRRANQVTRRLRSGKPDTFEHALENSLFNLNQKIPIPKQTVALASIWWPLVLTTNYDNFFVDAFADRFDPAGLAVVGRGPEDCQRVLTSLSTAGRTLLWALQGHLGKPRPSRPDHERDNRLAREIVLDHAEYRRVTHREPHFRRAFAEVFRQRTLLFLGAGIAEPYFQELFGEVLEFYGPGSRTHYAILPRFEVDPRFMYSRFQIGVVEYDPEDYDQVPKLIEELGGAFKKRTSVPVSWSWGMAAISEDHTGRSSILNNTPALEVFCGALPTTPVSDECLAVSAGGARRLPSFFLSTAVQSTVGAWTKQLISNQVKPDILDSEGFVGPIGPHVFAVRARSADTDRKDLSKIGPAAWALFDALVNRDYKRIHMQLLASGGDQKDETIWSRRPFPARFAFIEIVRTWGRWKQQHPSNTCCLTLHVVDPEVTRELASGRIDVNEVLLCNDLRFWAEVVEADGSLERRLFQKNPLATIREVVTELGLATAFWTIDVSPPVSIDDRKSDPPNLDDWLDRTLQEITIVPGGTIHLHRRAEPQKQAAT